MLLLSLGRYLALTDNTFHGGIPADLSTLVALRILALSSNALTGSLPSGLSALSRLTWVECDAASRVAAGLSDAYW